MKTRLQSFLLSLFPSSYEHPEQEALPSTLFPLFKGQQATPASCFTPFAVLREKLGLRTLLVQEPAFQFSARTGSGLMERPGLGNSSCLLLFKVLFKSTSAVSR